MNRANPEQMEAIEKSGGVLLNAGAGSGKTFVIVEHLIYKLQQLEKDSLQWNELVRPVLIKDQLDKIAVITYTNKAASELEKRIRKRIEDFVEVDSTQYWQMIQSNLHYINISTIHSFLLKILNRLPSPSIPKGNLNIISQSRIEDRIRSLAERFLFHVDRKNTAFSSIHFENIVQSVCTIYLDAYKRCKWPNKTSYFRSEEDYLSDLFSLFYLDKDALARDLSLNKEDENRPYYNLLSEFSQIWNKSFFDLMDLFTRYKGVRGPKEDKNPILFKQFELLKEFREWVRKNNPAIEVFHRENNPSIEEALPNISELIGFVEERYSFFEGISYADIEYYAFKGIEDLKEFPSYYIVIDEFQDTSPLQFEILLKLAANSYDNLYCVGDLKQAIYGFRGGSTSVFIDGLEKFRFPLSLVNNYRSQAPIIEFNNYLFHFLSQKRKKNEKGIVWKEQIAINTAKNAGSIAGLEINCDHLPEKTKFNAQLIESLESQGIVQIIQSMDQEERYDVCVLSKNMRPLYRLAPLLKENGIGFTLRVKVDLYNGPMIGILRPLCQYLVFTKGKDEFDDASQRTVAGILNAINLELKRMGWDQADVDSSILADFFHNTCFYGLHLSFGLFITRLGRFDLKGIEFDLVLDLINRLGEDEQRILTELNSNNSEDFYEQVISGDGKIQLMTVHASKGLEFDTVILAGVHNNGRSRNDDNLLGESKASFKWAQGEYLGKLIPNPEFLLEKLKNQRQGQAENIRLFYVACSRPKRALYWPEVSAHGERKSVGSENWINYLDEFWGQWDPNLDFWQKKKLPAEELKEEIRHKNQNEYIGPIHRYQGHLGITTELSASSLSLLAACPTMFYLSQVCQFEGKYFEASEIEKNSDKFYSSKKRGTKIHKALADILEFDQELEQVSFLSREEDIAAIQWALSVLPKNGPDHELFVEKEIKFSFFGKMITAIPDLFVLNKENNSWQVLDFKTGGHDQLNEVVYSTQVKIYAYGLMQLGIIEKTQRVSLKLVYLDSKLVVEDRKNFKELEEELQQIKKKLGEFSQRNLDYCDHCFYKSICY